MSTKAIVSGALILAVLGGWTNRAGAQPAPETKPEVLPPPAASTSPTSPLPNVLPGQGGLPPGSHGLPAGSVPDPWITYSRPDCCGPWGNDGPIGWEYYLRTGPAIAMSDTFLGQALDTGWMTAIGARTMLFNRPTDAAWTFDFGLSYTYNNGGRPDFTYPLPVLQLSGQDFQGNPITVPSIVDVSARAYHRSSVNFAVGREWYPFKPAYSPGWNYRIGFDTGGRYGASRVELNYAIPDQTMPGYLRRYDVFGAYFISLHNDLEIPFGCGKIITGFRAEWNYNWSDILLTRHGDMQDINLLLNLGYRY